MIAREGTVPLVAAGAAGFAVAFVANPLWSVPLWLVVAGLVYLYREQSRVAATPPVAVVSPAAGRVDAVEEAYDPWLERKALRIGVALPRPGITMVRSPVEGKMQRYWTDRESTTDGPESAFESPTCYAMWLTTDAGDDVVYAVSSRRSHSRFRTDVAPGERAGKGHRAGFVYFASRVDVLVPDRSTPEVAIGDRVAGGSGVLASLYRK